MAFQASSGRWNQLTQELDILVQEGKIGEEVRDRLLAIGRPAERKFDSGRFLFLAFVTLGVCMLGLAVFLLIGFNWKYLSPDFKLGMIFSGMALTTFGAFWGRFRERHMLSELFFFALAILYGVGIWQIAQIFNLPSNYHHGIWLWALGSLLIALWQRTPIVHCLTCLLLIIWFFCKAVMPSFGMYDPSPAEWFTFGFSNMGVSLPFLVLPGLVWSRLHGSRLAMALYLAVLWWWGVWQTVVWQMDEISPYYLVALGTLFCLLGQSLVRDRRISTFLVVLGLPLLLIVFSCCSFMDCNKEIGHIAKFFSKGDIVWVQVLGLIPLAIIILLNGAAQVIGYRRGLWSFRVARVDFWLSPPVLGVLFAVTALLPFFSHIIYEIPFIMTLIGNGGMLGLAWWMLHRGQTHNALWYWCGILYFLLWSLLRYLDLFGEAGGMLGASALFAAMAVLLFTAAWFRHRYPPTIVEKTETENENNSDIFPTVYEGPARNGWLILSVILLFGILTSMVLSNIIPFRDAKTVVVETMPVDPRDLFRGDYVILSYSFSQLSGMRWNSMTQKQEKVFDTEELVHPHSGMSIYATLQYDDKDEVWKPVRLSPMEPEAGKIFLRGIVRNYWEARYGIESYYVQEGTGLVLEQAMRRGSDSPVRVELLVAPDGRSRVQRVWIDPRSKSSSPAPEAAVPAVPAETPASDEP